MRIVAGGISMGTSSQIAQTMWAFKAGRRLHASPRAQVIAQIIGALLGALVVVPVYVVVIRRLSPRQRGHAGDERAHLEGDRRGGPRRPRVAAEVRPARRGDRNRPGYDPHPARPHETRSLSAVADGDGESRPWCQRRRRRPSSWSRCARALPAPLAQDPEDSLTSAAAGGIAGESIMGVMIAVMIAFGII